MSSTRTASKRPDARDKRANAKAIAMTIACVAIASGRIPIAAAQSQIWLAQFGTQGSEKALAVAADGAGGIMVGGYKEYYGIAGMDGFLARYDEAGDPIWELDLGTAGSERVLALTNDGENGVMVGGYTSFNLGGPSAGGKDAFLARYDGNGNQLWIRQFGSRNNEQALALAPDASGGVIVAGSTSGVVWGINAGSLDAFLMRYDAAGNWLWSRQFGTSKADAAVAVAPDGSGGAYVGWRVTRERYYHDSRFESFVSRYDADGNELWTTGIGNGEHMAVNGLVYCPESGVMASGYTTPDSRVHEAFVARINEDGNEQWIQKLGSGAYANAITSDGDGGAVIAGHVYGALGGPSAGDTDAWIARYDGEGRRLWLRQIGSTKDDRFSALTFDDTGTVIVAGMTSGNLGSSAGGSDALLARYTIDSCYADCDSTGSGALNIFDFLCWQNEFVIGNSYACDCDTSTGPLVCDMLDFICYQEAFISGCP